MPGQKASYGLKYHARCLCAQSGDKSVNRWLTATSALNEENEIQLLEMDARSEQLRSKGAYTHQHEIVAMASHPTNASLLCTAYNASGNFGVKFWFLPKEGNELEEKAELPTGKSQIVNVTWNQNQSDQIAVLSQNTSQIHNFDGSSVQESRRIDAETGSTFSAGCWHKEAQQFVLSNNGSLKVWDTRTKSISQSREKAHIGDIRDIDVSNSSNPLFASGGDDCYTRIWDPRKFVDPIAAYNHHSHWVWQTKFNPKHEQLLATSSSDSTVSLIHLGDLAKQKPISHHRSPSSMAKGQGNKTGPVESFSHDDSIYSIAWGPKDEWTLASLSYDGRVSVNQVPGNLKYSILL